MTSDDLLAHFDAVTPAGNEQWNARCPAHDDRHASLSIGIGDNGYVLHCHAGCDNQQIVPAANLAWADLFFDSGDGKVISLRRTQPAPRPAVSRQRDSVPLPSEDLIDLWASDVDMVADRLHALKGWTLSTLQRLRVGWDGQRVTLPIYGPAEELVQVIRYLPTRKPKILAIRGHGRHLYPAPESFPSERIWLVEGEPDAISMAELGVAAVSVPGVATWRDPWCERFLHKQVTVCMDADREGRQCAQDRAEMLRNYGVRCAIVDIAPDRSDGSDIGDFLATAVQQDRINALKAYMDRLEQQAWDETAGRLAA